MLTIQERLNNYEKALFVYTLCRILPARWFAANHGFCTFFFFSFHKGMKAYDFDLETLYPELVEIRLQLTSKPHAYTGIYWYPVTDMRSRVIHLRQTIKLTKENIQACGQLQL